MGGDSHARPAPLRVLLPRQAGIRLVRDGRAIHEAHAAHVDLDVDDPASIESRRASTAGSGLLSNPIHLR
jgi:hypothetical protein